MLPPLFERRSPPGAGRSLSETQRRTEAPNFVSLTPSEGSASLRLCGFALKPEGRGAGNSAFDPELEQASEADSLPTMPLTRKLVLLCGILGLVGGLMLSWAAGSLMVRGQASAVPPAKAPAGDLRIRTPDGLALAATYWPGRRPNSPAVLLLHGVKASRASTAPTAAWLHGLGYAALTVDFRGHGESDMAERSFGLREAADARSAFEWLKRRQGGARVAVIGNSLGGAAPLLGPAGPLPADALVLQAVYPDIRRAIRNRIADRLTAAPAHILEPLLSLQSKPRFGVWPGDLSPLEALRRYPGPVLVIGGAEDRYTPLEETRALFAAAPGRKSLWIVPGKGHAAIGELSDEAYRARIGRFLRSAIGKP
jgi:pimeloyl-ACP methyl ester carboxylesterase